MWPVRSHRRRDCFGRVDHPAVTQLRNARAMTAVITPNRAPTMNPYTITERARALRAAAMCPTVAIAAYAGWP
jgi:hypothetical protein